MTAVGDRNRDANLCGADGCSTIFKTVDFLYFSLFVMMFALMLFVLLTITYVIL